MVYPPVRVYINTRVIKIVLPKGRGTATGFYERAGCQGYRCGGRKVR
jgi:hypothetical protein